MSGLFLNLYLWRLTQSLWINGIYNAILYGVIPFAFAIGGWISKKWDRMFTYRIGIGLITAFFLVVVFARENVAAYYAWFGLFNGIALGLYWTGYLVLMYDITEDRNRGHYLAVNMIVFNSAGLLGPALAGFLIGMFKGLQGYIVTFAIACAMFFTAFLFSTKIRKVESHHRVFYLKYTFPMMKREPTWVKALISFFILGLFQGMMLFLPNILLFRTMGREDAVGLLTVFFSLLTILTGFFISRNQKRRKVRAEMLLTSACLLAASCMLLLFGVHDWSVIAYMVVFSLMNPLTVNTLTSYYYRVMDFLPLKGHFRIESVVIRELFLNIGRVISILLLILFAPSPESPSLPIVLVAAAVLQFAIAGLVTKVQR